MYLVLVMALAGQVEVRHVQHVDAYVAEQHQQAVASAMTREAALKRQLRELRGRRREAAQVRLQLQRESERLAQLKRGEPRPADYVEAFGDGLKKNGDVALLGERDDEWIRVSDVVDGEQFIGYYDHVRTVTTPGPVEGSSVQRPQLERGDRPYWFRGFDTAGLSNEERVKLIGVYTVTGTQEYTTVLGGKVTALVVEPYEPPKEDQ